MIFGLNMEMAIIFIAELVLHSLIVLLCPDSPVVSQGAGNYSNIESVSNFEERLKPLYYWLNPYL